MALSVDGDAVPAPYQLTGKIVGIRLYASDVWGELWRDHADVHQAAAGAARAPRPRSHPQAGISLGDGVGFSVSPAVHTRPCGACRMTATSIGVSAQLTRRKS